MKAKKSRFSIRLNLLMIFFLISTSSYSLLAQHIEIPDAVFLQKLIDAGVDTNGDGLIQHEEALSRIHLGVSSNLWDDDEDKIQSLEGIQYFTNLKTFSCKGNKITHLDVRALDQLEVLHCYYNELTTLLVDGLSELQTLWAFNNQLSEVNLTGLTSLWFLFISNNELTQLDFSTNTSLEALWGDNNQLESIDFTHNPLMTDIGVSNNMLTSIEVGHLNELINLGCINNQITSIDVASLENLYALHIDNNLITEIDGSSSPNFTKLHCSNNPNLTYINMKNGAISYTYPDDMPYWSFVFENLPSLSFVCIDEGEEYALSESGYDAENVIISTDVCVFSTQNFTSLETSIYPNPVTSKVYLNTQAQTIKSLQVFDIYGKKQLKLANYDQDYLDVSNLASGTYLVQIETEVGTFTHKMQKK